MILLERYGRRAERSVTLLRKSSRDPCTRTTQVSLTNQPSKERGGGTGGACERSMIAKVKRGYS